jgi:hypothetical protein
LKRAIISSAETSDKQKHELLARVVSDRLTKQSESLFALSSKLACDALSACNISQLKILGLLVTLTFVRPRNFPPPGYPKEVLNVIFQEWLIPMVQPYGDLNFIDQDFLHLESLSCIKLDAFLSRDFKELFAYRKETGFKFDYAAFSATNVGKLIVQLWESGLKYAIPTTIGQLIGIYVSDMLTGTNTTLDSWWVKT